MVYLTLRKLEGPVAMKNRKFERGQSTLLFAMLLPIMALFLLGILDTMITNARTMETVAAADLAAAQEVILLPNGVITTTTRGRSVAASYFNSQSPGNAHLSFVTCGRFQNRPACLVRVQVQSAGYLIPRRWISVSAIGYLTNGVTRGDQ